MRPAKVIAAPPAPQKPTPAVAPLATPAPQQPTAPVAATVPVVQVKPVAAAAPTPAHKKFEHAPRPSSRRDYAEPQRVRSPKHSRATPGDQTRLYMNVGAEMGIAPGDVVGAILGETGLPAKVVGTVDIR